MLEWLRRLFRPIDPHREARKIVYSMMQKAELEYIRALQKEKETPGNSMMPAINSHCHAVKCLALSEVCQALLFPERRQ
jgi:hypothetical protein